MLKSGNGCNGMWRSTGGTERTRSGLHAQCGASGRQFVRFRTLATSIFDAQAVAVCFNSDGVLALGQEPVATIDEVSAQRHSAAEATQPNAATIERPATLRVKNFDRVAEASGRSLDGAK